MKVYLRSYIDGATDFIFGQRARAWFGKCDIRVKGAGYITANGRDSSSNPSYYIISDSNVATASGSSVASGSVYLGRPWRNYSRVVVQNTQLSNIINGAGWLVWSSGSPNTGNVYYREFNNAGAGASGSRVGSFQYMTSSRSDECFRPNFRESCLPQTLWRCFLGARTRAGWTHRTCERVRDIWRMLYKFIMYLYSPEEPNQILDVLKVYYST